MESYPVELKEAPRPLVAALGPKDIQARVLPVLRSINEEFVPHVQFKSLSFDHRYVFPTKKDKTASPSKGIWKAGWLKKHHEVLPSVVLLFYAFEPRLASRDWAIQETVIRDEVEDFRRTLSGRDVKILLVLVQLLDDATSSASPASTMSSSMVNLPSSDDRLQSLRKRAELDAKSVWFVKDIVSRTHPTLIKLEAAIRTNAVEYYKAQAKRVKKAKKPTKLVGIRHSFKVAHYYEFRNYTSKMLLHYEAAYKALLHLAAGGDADDGADLHRQLVAVAEYIHYKLVYHAIFSSHHLKGAVDQLHRHMTAFGRLPPSILHAKKDDVGAATCAHWGYVSRQYHVFGQLVLESQRLGLHASPSNSYHNNVLAGLDSDLYKEAYLYFSAAAKYATWRRKAAAKAGLSYDVSLDPATVATAPSPFLGGDAIVPIAEKTIPHAALAIQLLSQAIHHVTVHLNHRYRLKHRLLLRLGLEQLANGEFAVARQGLEKAKAAYIQERWYGQVSQVLSHLLICATHQRDTLAFLELSVQLLSPKLELFVAPTHRDTLHANLFVAFDQWTTSPPDLALDALKNVVSVYVDFGKAVKAFVRETVTFTATVESYLPVDVSLHSLSFVFAPEDSFNQHLHHDTADLRLPPHTPRTFQMALTLPATQTTVMCQQVRLVFRNRHDVSWTWTVTSFVPQTILTRRNSLLAEMQGVIPGMGQGAGSPSFQRKPTTSLDFEDVTGAGLEDDGRLGGRGQVVVMQPKARATLDLLCSQVLVGHTAPLQFVLHSHDDHIHDPQYTIHVAESPLSPGGGNRPQTAQLVFRPDAPALTSPQRPHSEQPFTVWLHCATARDVVLNVHMTYQTALGVQVSLDTTFAVHAVAPFALTSTLHWTYPNRAARVGSPFTVVAQLAATAPLHLQSVGLANLSAHATFSSSTTRDFRPKKLGAGDQHSVVLRVLPHQVVKSPHPLGDVVVEWTAEDAGESTRDDVVTTVLALPKVAFASVPLSVDVAIPEFGVEGELSLVRIQLTNHTAGIVVLAVNIANEGSDFLVSGAVDAKVNVLPLETYAFTVGIVPLHPGQLKLPSIDVVHVDSKESFVAADQRMALFVVPYNHSMSTYCGHADV
ncbi:hypothetical protein H310_13870 [Aphanomyces invadans]|uniref:Uncharacterized protein n=1 Tax=Aphanomyces invadans TaxID=157072 RepID=A0A024TBS8_9STRA|nr:hypothetical protein H310_13870 [Aphanomyces invadans]ETV91620.1 hypothetical protein H310_13870 [Aphanomyces invadans]|eukprot:XP_008879739.1 hypothetical protein H310_13870 [Aphanomyces invadans]